MIDSFDDRQIGVEVLGVTVPEAPCKNFSTGVGDFFFINQTYLDTYNQLLEGVCQKGGLFVITGPVGIGKTLLLHQMANAAPKSLKFVFCTANDLDYENLLALIGNQLGIVDQNGDIFGKLNGLKNCFNDFSAQGINIILLIDDAHCLHADVLSYLVGLLDLSNQWLPEDYALRIVLSGIPDLELTLQKVQITAQNIPQDTVYGRLESLSRADVAAFISRPLKNGDIFDVNSLFPSDELAKEAIEKIAHYTGGSPRLINALCKRILSGMQRGEGEILSIASIEEAANELMLQEKTIIQNGVAPDGAGALHAAGGMFSEPDPSDHLPITAVSREPAKNVLESLLNSDESGTGFDQAVHDPLLQDRAAYPVTAVSFEATRSMVGSIPHRDTRAVAKDALESLLNLDESGTGFDQTVHDPLLQDRAAYPVTAVSFEATRSMVGSIPHRDTRAVAKDALESLLNSDESGTGFEQAVHDPLLQDRTAYPVTAVSFETARFANENQLLQAKNPPDESGQRNSLTDDDRKELINSLLMDETGSGLAVAMPWNDLPLERKYPRLFQSTYVRVGLVMLLALLAGLGGGIASLYLFQQLPDPIVIELPTPAAGISTPAPAPVPMQPSPMVGSAPNFAQEVKVNPPPAEPSAAPINTLPSAARSAGVGSSPGAALQPPPGVISPPAVVPEIASAVSTSVVEKVTETPLIASYMKKGHALLALGDVASARLFYEIAADSGFAEAMTAVGGTYDPVVLDGQGIKGFRADPVKAAEWYLKAEKAGDLEVITRLDGLKRWLSNTPTLQEAEVNALRQRLH